MLQKIKEAIDSVLSKPGTGTEREDVMLLFWIFYLISPQYNSGDAEEIRAHIWEKGIKNPCFAPIPVLS